MRPEFRLVPTGRMLVASGAAIAGNGRTYAKGKLVGGSLLRSNDSPQANNQGNDVVELRQSMCQLGFQES